MNPLLLFQSSTGIAPFSKWLRGLSDQRGRAIIRARLNRLVFGNFGDCRSLGGGLFEVRIDFGPGYRVYATFEDDSVVLLCGGDKGSQKRDIARARRFLKEWNDEG